jgi:hypothetical protein
MKRRQRADWRGGNGSLIEISRSTTVAKERRVPFPFAWPASAGIRVSG